MRAQPEVPNARRTASTKRFRLALFRLVPPARSAHGGVRWWK